MTEWDRCAPWLQAALDRSSPTDTLDDIRQEFERGEWDLWPGESFAALAQVVQHNRLKDYHIWLAGGDLAEIERALGSLKAFAKARGCDRVTINGRRGWIKALGMREIFTAGAIDL